MTLLRRVLIILGTILIIISICIGISIIIFSFKFMNGLWLTVWEYIVSMIGLGIAGFCIGFLGLFIIYVVGDKNIE